MRLWRVLFLESISVTELTMLFTALLFSGLVSVVVADSAFFKAVVTSLPLPELKASMHLVPSQHSALVIKKINVVGVLNSIREVFIREFSMRAWILLMVEAISVSMIAYPFYERTRVQLPVLIYRISTTPCRAYWCFIFLIFLLSTPLILTTLSVPVLELWLNNIPLTASALAVLLPFAVSVFSLPVLFSSLVLASNRYDYSLLVTVVLVIALYSLRLPAQTLIMSLAYILLTVLLCRYVGRRRWVE